jgi:hypothetical protein
MLSVKKHLVCDVCGKSVSNRCHLAHMRIHTSGKPCVCIVCWKALKKPENTHTQVRNSTPVALVGSHLHSG